MTFDPAFVSALIEDVFLLGLLYGMLLALLASAAYGLLHVFVRVLRVFFTV